MVLNSKKLLCNNDMKLAFQIRKRKQNIQKIRQKQADNDYNLLSSIFRHFEQIKGYNIVTKRLQVISCKVKSITWGQQFQ